MLIAALTGANAAHGQTAQASVLKQEFFAGVDVTRDAWLAYGGATLAVGGGDVWTPGWKLRAGAGYGQYRYNYTVESGLAGGALERQFDATTTYTDAMIGYLERVGPLTAKLFGRLAYIDHAINPVDPHNPVSGRAWGPKAAIELWLNIGSDAWASLDVTYTTAHETAAARTRIGYRILPTVSAGLEAGLNRNALDMGGRGGAFLRYEWFGGEISLGAGVATGEFQGLMPDLADGVAPYATLNVVMQF